MTTLPAPRLKLTILKLVFHPEVVNGVLEYNTAASILNRIVLSIIMR